MAHQTSINAAGYHICDTPDDKIGLHGATPAPQRSGADGAALTDSTGGSTADTTLAAVGDTSAGDESEAINDNFAKIARLLNELRATLVEKGLHKGSA